jgi:ABC-type phosphate transport system permease subunit
MENLLLMFIFAIIFIAIISFIFPNQKKTRTRLAKESVKQELPGFLYLFVTALVIVILLTVGNAIF